MRSNDEIRTLVRERYGAIVREGVSCCAPASCGCGPEIAPDGLNMIGDAYAGVAMPVEDGSVDVVISNCVLNLVPDKASAFAEMFRVLRPGGRFCVSDIVATGELPPPVRDAAGLYVGCVAGAVPEAQYLALLGEVGFERVHVAEAKPVALPDDALAPHMDAAELAAFRASSIVLRSVIVLGSKPATAN